MQVPALSAAKKAILWFVVTFLGLLIPSVLDAIVNYTGTLDLNAVKAVFLPLVGAAFVAACRMAIAYFPILDQDNNIGMSKEG